MEAIYKQLGFILENDYGIKIYIGTKDQSDWCIEIPNEISKLKCPGYISNVNDILYGISEETALEIAAECNEIMTKKTIQENQIENATSIPNYKNTYFMKICGKTLKNVVWSRLVRCPYCNVQRDVRIIQTRCKCPNCNNWFSVK